MRYDVRIDRLPLSALFDLRGEARALAGWGGSVLPPFPEGPNRRTEQDGLALCHLGPRRWLLLGAIEREAEVEAALRPGEAPAEISVVRVSDTLTFFRVAGPEAAEVLALGCPLDLHPSVFPEDGASFTDLFGLKGLVLRVADGFEIAVDRSLAAMAEDWLGRATG